MTTKSVLQQLRASYQPKLPNALCGAVKVQVGQPTQSVADQDAIQELFPTTYGLPQLTFVPDKNAKTATKPLNVGVILSGGQAPGGHNVISGIYDGIKNIHPDSRLYGFLMGPDGLVNHDYKELTGDIIDEYRNTGGFDIIGSGRTKLDKEEQFERGLEIIKKLDLQAIVIIGGDDSNTNAAIMAEYYKAHGAPVQVIGCPKTIDGDLKNEFIETSFGFDTATKVYSELIGNVERDCNSARKYWHFMKLMGRSASHIALECALQTQPNLCLISEEVEEYCLELSDIVTSITNTVVKRAKRGLNFGTVLVPEGLIEFIPSCKSLIEQLNEIMAKFKPEVSTLDPDAQVVFIREHLTPENLATLDALPKALGRQLMLDRDPHGNVQVSLIETEKLLSTLVKKKLKQINKGKQKNDPDYVNFKAMHHFFGYEGRCAAPSNFDADYCYALGYNAAQLINCGATGYMSSVRDLIKPSSEWICGGIPITMMMNMERRNGEDKPVIRKALVDMKGRPFTEFANMRATWAKETCYVYPGPIQYFGPSELIDQPTKTLVLEHSEE